VVAFAEDADWSPKDVSFELSGSLRQLGLYTRSTDRDQFEDDIEDDLADGNLRCVLADEFSDCPAFDRVGEKEIGQGLTRLRVQLDVDVHEGVSAVVIYDNEASYGVFDTFEGQLGDNLGTDSFLGAEATLESGEHYTWRHELYRGYLKFENERFEVSIGRQRVAWGVGRLWTPIDRFSAVPPLSLQPDVTSGIDGIDARFNIDGFSYLQVVYAPGGSKREARYAGRLHGVLWDADLSLMGGVFEKAPTVGADFARNLGDAAVRFEVVYTDPKHKVFEIGSAKPKAPDDFWQVVASFDINLEIGTGVYVLSEYLYNGNALGFGKGKAGVLLPLFEATNEAPAPGLGDGPFVTGASGDAFGSSRVITLATHQLGFQLGYDLTPELRGDFVTIVDMNRGSATFFPNLAYSPLDSLEISLGVQLFTGPRRSQYGASEPLVFLLTDWFF